MNIGMTSVTFRNKTIREIVSIAKKAGLSCIEWGSDVHCPNDSPASLSEARELTEKAGLTVSSYGSYYRLGTENEPETVFDAYCRAAKVLGARRIRIWAYSEARRNTDEKTYRRCVAEAQSLSEIAARYELVVCFEYHRHTLTETADDAKVLIEDINRANVRLYWQPNPEISDEENRAELNEVLPYVETIHAFHWIRENGADKRLPFEEGKPIWKRYLEEAAGKVDTVLLEFTCDNTDGMFLRDAAALKELLNAK